MELERLMSEVSDAGIVFMVRDGAIVSMSFRKGKPSDSILMKIKASKAAIEGYLRGNNSAVRCFRCPKCEVCQDGTACQYPPA